MTDRLFIAIAQIDPTVGDVAGNADRIRRARAAARGAARVVIPERGRAGEQPADLVLKPDFQEACREACEALAAETADGGPALLVGLPWPEDGRLYNAVALLDGGEAAAVRHKVLLPNYGVFDEKRVFDPGEMPGPVSFRDVRIGVPICEDIWQPAVVECLEENGAEMLLVPNGSPFETTKDDIRLNIAVERVVESGLPLAYVNQVGGQDELVFDGASFVLGRDRALRAQLPAWTESVAITRWERGADGMDCTGGPMAEGNGGLSDIYSAMMLGLRDYVNKNCFPGVVLGLSGGIDSALSAAVAVDALGPERVRCVMMPSPYTSQASLDDALEAVTALGASYETISIEPAMGAFGGMLASAFGNRGEDTTEENIQAPAS
ncbi:MAG: NAD+ synthase, partial [Alphaproteobacteria bacterium]|nr:NAD+ synthase [Alphaproteobacteria bacterium]